MPNTNQPPAEPKLSVILKTDGGLAVISLEGRLDAATVGQFDTAWASALEGGAGRCVVEMSGLEFISSAGLHSLLVLARRLDADKGTLCCCGLTENVRDVFSIAGFTKVFQIVDTLDEATAAGKDA